MASISLTTNGGGLSVSMDCRSMSAVALAPDAANRNLPRVMKSAGAVLVGGGSVAILMGRDAIRSVVARSADRTG